MPESIATVATASAEAHLKQLVRAMGREVPVIHEGRIAEIRFDFGTGHVTASSAQLELRALAQTDDDLLRVTSALSEGVSDVALTWGHDG